MFAVKRRNERKNAEEGKGAYRQASEAMAVGVGAFSSQTEAD